MTEEQEVPDEFQQEVNRLSQIEAEAYQYFRLTYETIHLAPQPVKAIMDWEFWTSLSTSISGVALAAFRTGQAFYLAASYAGNKVFSWAEAIVAVIAIEGSLVLFALQDARSKRKSMDRNARVFGLAITLVISAVAGLYQSSGILMDGGQFVTVLNWMLVLLMGIGATAIAFLGGDILGVQIVRYEEAQKELTVRFQQEQDAYEQGLLLAWEQSKEFAAVNSRKRTNYRNDQTNDQRTPVRSRPQRTNERTPANEQSRIEIFGLMDMMFIETGGTVPGQANVCRRLALARDGSEAGFERYKGYVNKVWKEWTPPQKIELPQPVEEEERYG